MACLRIFAIRSLVALVAGFCSFMVVFAVAGNFYEEVANKLLQGRTQTCFAPSVGRTPKCLESAKMKACVFLQQQARQNFGVELNCSRFEVEKFATSVSLFFYSVLENWRRKLDKSQIENEILHVCDHVSTEGCQLCFERLKLAIKIDLRLSEAQALEIINVCKGQTLNSLLSSFAGIKPWLFEYSRENQGKMDYDSGKGCRPERYCAPFRSSFVTATKNLGKKCEFSPNGELLTPVVLFEGTKSGVDTTLIRWSFSLLISEPVMPPE